ncbi:nucleotidyltransferase domain-containing protein [Mycolicibacterium houstonense]|uniref:nucleotidyltransferase domain-containing protein n=1 Tax=Mycolicibacterium houstonense TaxID=146021 RepID=UPI00093E2729|nr:nucleotidyltransferase domain-containing protein [Mycolicibacterium houstonense]
MADLEILSARATYSNLRLDELKNRIKSRSEAHAIDNFAIFCAGSYAREEASSYSDIDLFFLYGPGVKSEAQSHIKEVSLFASVIEVANAMQFPPFSNDGQYLQTLSCNDILEHLGSPKDDELNFFTMRMLLLLESACVYGEEVFAGAQRAMIAAYFRDYPDHQSSFEPWFLINDIGRFWKTLLLNYEHKRNQPAADVVQKNKQKVKNFKLKYSRMTTCFATIAALASLSDPTEESIHCLVQKSPQERLRAVAKTLPEVDALVNEVLEKYAWFIEQTGQTEELLRSGFEDKKHRTERFQRANEYGDAMFDLISAIGEVRGNGEGDRNRLLRYLVI